MHIVRILRRTRSFLRRVSESADALELHLLEELEQLFGLRIRLAREPDNARRTNSDIGDGSAESLHALANRPLALRTSHTREDFIRPVLDRHCSVRQHSALARNDV